VKETHCAWSNSAALTSRIGSRHCTNIVPSKNNPTKSGDSMPKPSAHLTSRDRKVLEHVFRHRLGTDEILRRCFFPDVQGSRPVRKVMTRLVERKFLREYSLAPNEFYYILAPRGARAI